jgi:hypothetical protein
MVGVPIQRWPDDAELFLLVDPLDQPFGHPRGRVFFVGSVRALPAARGPADLASPELLHSAGHPDVAASVRLIRQVGSVPVVELVPVDSPIVVAGVFTSLVIGQPDPRVGQVRMLADVAYQRLLDARPVRLPEDLRCLVVCLPAPYTRAWDTGADELAPERIRRKIVRSELIHPQFTRLNGGLEAAEYLVVVVPVVDEVQRVRTGWWVCGVWRADLVPQPGPPGTYSMALQEDDLDAAALRNLLLWQLLQDEDGHPWPRVVPTPTYVPGRTVR